MKTKILQQISIIWLMLTKWKEQRTQLLNFLIFGNAIYCKTCSWMPHDFLRYIAVSEIFWGKQSWVHIFATRRLLRSFYVARAYYVLLYTFVLSSCSLHLDKLPWSNAAILLLNPSDHSSSKKKNNTAFLGDLKELVHGLFGPNTADIVQYL